EHRLAWPCRQNRRRHRRRGRHGPRHRRSLCRGGRRRRPARPREGGAAGARGPAHRRRRPRRRHPLRHRIRGQHRGCRPRLGRQARPGRYPGQQCRHPACRPAGHPPPRGVEHAARREPHRLPALRPGLPPADARPRRGIGPHRLHRGEQPAAAQRRLQPEQGGRRHALPPARTGMGAGRHSQQCREPRPHPHADVGELLPGAGREGAAGGDAAAPPHRHAAGHCRCRDLPRQRAGRLRHRRRDPGRWRPRPGHHGAHPAPGLL
ncbi:MAG: 3-oxoacyl-[acyl-carrier protein] reductase, partial [uncultured Craurococcus sp.]